MHHGMDTEGTDDTSEWAAIEGALPDGWKELAKTYGLIRPQPPQLKTKVTDIGQVLRLIFYHVAWNVALLTTTGAFAAANLLELSSVALHKWMIKIGPYLAELSARMAKEDKMFAPARWAGYDVKAADATTVTRPGAMGTTARVHKALRLSDMRVTQVDVTDEKGGETLRRFDVQEGELWILDRIYANPPGVAHATDRKGAVVVRYNRGALPLYDADGRPLDVWSKLTQLHNPLQMSEWEAWVRPAQGESIRGRLCAIRLPADKAEEARVRLRREQGSELTEESLAMADFVVLFTTVPHERLDTRLILELYRLRWQIELEFKRNKSITGLDKLPNFRQDTIFSWLQAKVLLRQIMRRLAAPRNNSSSEPSDSLPEHAQAA
jgi:hypothetical protein